VADSRKLPDQRGAAGSIADFAPRFIEGRLVGFAKDLKICLTGVPSPVAKKRTYAYFPALATCCSTLEYFVALHRGNLDPAGWRQVATYAAKYLPQPDFDQDTVRVLVEAFRHPIAHRGIESGVWVDRSNGPGAGRRLVWEVTAGTQRPACQLNAEAGTLTKDPPWPTPYTHRVQIHLGALWIDIRESARKYANDVSSDRQLQANFRACMQRLYPQ
jgi:hypothetical protein